MTADHRLAGGDELIHLLARNREAGADRQKPRASFAGDDTVVGKPCPDKNGDY
jgi:hypothetical protein